MTEQPCFGRRLRELRRASGLSQSALAGEEISTGYLSRLESGARQPTERVVGYLARQLNVDRSVFDVAPRGGSLAQALSVATSAEDGDEAAGVLLAALDTSHDEDLLLRWQALWLVSRHWRKRGETAQERACLEELVGIAEELSLPELQCRAWAQLARVLRAAGEARKAVDVALRAYRLAADAGLSVADTALALRSLVSVEAEIGRLPDARAHAEELLEVTERGSAVVRAEALWSAAAVCARQGDHDRAQDCLERAIDGLDSGADLILWGRVRLAAAALYLLKAEPPMTVRARECLAEASAAFSLVGTAPLRQELLLLQAYLAFREERFADARAAHDQLTAGDLRLDHRDRVRLSVLDGRLLLLEGEEERGIARLKELGEQARHASDIDLAADIWRVLAEVLEGAHRRDVAAGS